MFRSIVGFVVVALGVSTVSNELYAAQPSALIFGCDRSAKLRRTLTRSLESELDFVSRDMMRAAVRRTTGVDPVTHQEQLTLAKELGLEVLVRCRVAEDKVTTLEYVSADGTRLAEQTLKPAPKKRSSKALRKTIKRGGRKAVDALADLEERGPSPVVAAHTIEVVTETRAVVRPPEVAVKEEADDEIEDAPASSIAHESPRPTQVSFAMNQRSSRDARLVLLVGGSLRSYTTIPNGIQAGGTLQLPSVDVLVRARPLGSLGLLVDLEGGAALPTLNGTTERKSEFRFAFATSYLFDLAGIGFGPSLSVGIDPRAPGASMDRAVARVTRAGAVLVFPLVEEALTIRLQAALRPAFSSTFNSLLGTGYDGTASIEGTLGGGFSYALRADYVEMTGNSLPIHERSLGFGAMIGWRL